MNILVVDIGGTNVKVWRTGSSDKIKFASGKELTAESFADKIRIAADNWAFDHVSIGYPGEVVNGRPTKEPFNLGPGWVDLDFGAVFGCPVRMMNDACMQALGSYEGGKMLYLGLGTSVGSTLIYDKKIVALALGDLPFRGRSFEHFLSRKGLERDGRKRWLKSVEKASEILKTAFMADYIVLGGGNSKKVKELPAGCRRGHNQSAYFGGLKMWDNVTLKDVKPPLAFPVEEEELVEAMIES